MGTIRTLLSAMFLVGFTAVIVGTGVFFVALLVAPGAVVDSAAEGTNETIGETTVFERKVTEPTPTTTTSTPQRSSVTDTRTTQMPLPSDAGRKNYASEMRLDQTTYTWDTWRDPDDPGPSRATTERTRINSTAVEYFIFEEVNEIRTARGLEPYEYSQYLSSLGRAHSEDMYARNYFAHENPDGEQIWHRFKIDDWRDACEEVSENLAKNWAGLRVQRSGESGSTRFWTNEELADALVQQWMHSPPHREAMLRQRTDIMGIGVYVANTAQNSGAVVYATQGMCNYPDDESQWGNPADAPE